MKITTGIMIHSVRIKEGAVDCMRAGEVAKASEKMKKHKPPGLSVV